MKRQSFGLPDDLWEAVDDYRFSRRIGTRNEAVCLLLRKVLGKRVVKPSNHHGELKRKQRRPT